MEKPALPHSLEAEEALLGSVIINPDAYWELTDLITAEDFYLHRHRWIWESFTRLAARRTPIDFLILTEDLDTAGHLAEVGGAAYLTTLLTRTPTSLHAVAYAEIVRATAIRRRLLSAANEIAKAAFQEDQDLSETLNTAERAILAVAARASDRDLVPAADIVARVFDYVSAGAAARGLSTGFSALDEILAAGLRPSDLAVVAGRPGMGKTGFLLSLARHAALEPGRRVALFSLEMDADSVLMRLLAHQSQVDFERIRAPSLRPEDWPPFTTAAEILAASGLFVDDTALLTPTQLRTRCRRLHAAGGLHLVLIDYLQLMSGGGRFDNRAHEVAHISRQLKLIARELSVPVLAAAQLSRSVEQRNDKMPQLSDLRESGAIEQDADIVMFLYRDAETPNLTRLRIAKQRNGPTGEIELLFRNRLTKFENAERRPPVDS